MNTVYVPIILLSIIYYWYYYIGRMYVQSTINNRQYLVRNLPDSQHAANTLALLSKKCQDLITYLQNSDPDSIITKRLVAKYRPNNMSEGSSMRYTTYTVNKGDEMVFCLRSRDQKDHDKLHRLNLLTFVAIHEMAHIASVSIHHTKEFRENFKYLLNSAIRSGIYSDERFDENPTYYCGVLVTDNPLKN